GAHLRTYLGEPMRRLFAEHLGERWLHDPASPSAWERVREIDDAALWAARCESRDYAQAPLGLDPDTLTLGFARRLASYKRLGLLFSDPKRLSAILSGKNA